MDETKPDPETPRPGADERKEDAERELPAAARRALNEAGERRRRGLLDPVLPPEINGRKGPEPIRYGDWEKDGIASDF